MTDWNALGWGGWSLGQHDDDGDQIKILGEDAGVVGWGAKAAVGDRTPRLDGGSVFGRSVAGEATIVVPVLQTSSRAKARAFVASMEASDEDAVLEMAGLLYADDDDPGSESAGERVCMFARPQGARPVIDVLSTGLRVVHILDATWVAADPTVYSLATTTSPPLTPAGSHTLGFTNEGTLRTRAGRAWTATITAATACRSPFVELGGQRVEWTGLNLGAGQTLTVDRHRHSYVGSLGVDGYARSHGLRHLDWPTLKPGINGVKVGVLSGTCMTQMMARSTW